MRQTSHGLDFPANGRRLVLTSDGVSVWSRISQVGHDWQEVGWNDSGLKRLVSRRSIRTSRRLRLGQSEAARHLSQTIEARASRHAMCHVGNSPHQCDGSPASQLDGAELPAVCQIPRCQSVPCIIIRDCRTPSSLIGSPLEVCR